MARSSSRSWLFVASALLLAACASGSGGTSETDTAAAVGTNLAVIEVQHNLTNTSSALTIMIEPQTGVRANLGVVEAGENKRFTYNAVPGNHRLLAQGSITSNEFRLTNGDIATWNMQTNRVTVRGK